MWRRNGRQRKTCSEACRKARLARFADPADQEMCAGSWEVVEFRRGGNVSHTLEIALPIAAAA